MNVALGGCLRQDIVDEVTDALPHRDWELYEHNGHEVTFGDDPWLGDLYGRKTGWVNSIHHQSVNGLAPGCAVIARAVDGVVEAYRDPRRAFCVGVQWHPEFHLTPREENQRLLDSGPMMQAFLDAARARADRHRSAAAQAGKP